MHSFVVCATLSRSLFPRLALVFLILVMGASSAGAENAGKDTKVTQAYRNGSDQDSVVQLGDDVVVEVENLDTLLKKAQASSPAKKILLFLDGRPLKDVTPFPPTDPSKSILYFPLQRTERSRDIWTYILGKPGWKPRSIS